MHYIDFDEAQRKLNAYLSKKLMGATMNQALTKRAQKLVDKWWSELLAPVVVGTSGLQVTGCILGFQIGKIMVAQWRTKFVRDQFDLAHTVPSHIALGYASDHQLYIADVDGFPHLCARDTAVNVVRWSTKIDLIPPPTSVLFVALERAKALGYLEYLKGRK